MSNSAPSSPGRQRDPHDEYPLAEGTPRFLSSRYDDEAHAYRAVMEYHGHAGTTQEYRVLVYVEYMDPYGGTVLRVMPV